MNRILTRKSWSSPAAAARRLSCGSNLEIQRDWLPQQVFCTEMSTHPATTDFQQFVQQQQQQQQQQQPASARVNRIAAAMVGVRQPLAAPVAAAVGGQLAGKTAIVTGGTPVPPRTPPPPHPRPMQGCRLWVMLLHGAGGTGIGQGIALAFAAEGCR